MDLSGSSPLSFSSVRFLDVSCLASSSILFHLLESSHSLKGSSSTSPLLMSLRWKESSTCIASSSDPCRPPLTPRDFSSSSELFRPWPKPKASLLS
uniref:Uncharacterized protein n=1 Tax=Pelodiscus sinensis TaxID=13735 RepID=K7EYI8_PELSI